MRTPSIRDLSPAHRRVAVEAAQALQARGYRCWLVGGAVRDLALGLVPKDVDLATDATPDQVEAVFARTVAVGKAFGTIVVVLEDARGTGAPELEVTTLRRDGAYSDGRRPDRVEFGTSVDEDAARRDFTCNALFLDPLADAVTDPTGGLADLERSLLRAVGDPATRFHEDALRLLRMARFAAAHDLTIEPTTWDAAGAVRERLRAISPERVLSELSAMGLLPGAWRAVEILERTGLLDVALPAPQGISSAQSKAEQSPRVRGGAPATHVGRILAALADAPGPALLLAVLTWSETQGGPEPERVERLRPARTLLDEIRAVRALVAALRDLPERADPSDWDARARRVRAARHPAWEATTRLLAARAACGLEDLGSRVEAAEEAARAAVSDDELRGDPFLTSDDLAAAGVPRGRRWGELLAECDARRLGGDLPDRGAALEWLRGQPDAGD